MIDWLGQAIADGIYAAWGAPTGTPAPTPPAPVGDPEPPDPFEVKKWGYDPDVFAEVCRLQAEWCRSDGLDRYWAGRRYRKAVGDLYPHADVPPVAKAA